MAFHYFFPVAHPAQRIHCLCGSAMQLKNVSPFLLVRYRLGKTPKLGFQKAYLILYKFRKGHPYYTPNKLARNGCRCCLLLAGSKISLSPFLPVSILIDSLLPSRLARFFFSSKIVDEKCPLSFIYFRFLSVLCGIFFSLSYLRTRIRENSFYFMIKRELLQRSYRSWQGVERLSSSHQPFSFLKHHFSGHFPRPSTPYYEIEEGKVMNCNALSEIRSSPNPLSQLLFESRSLESKPRPTSPRNYDFELRIARIRSKSSGHKGTKHYTILSISLVRML